jgi:hypothetical protein
VTDLQSSLPTSPSYQYTIEHDCSRISKKYSWRSENSDCCAELQNPCDKLNLKFRRENAIIDMNGRVAFKHAPQRCLVVLDGRLAAAQQWPPVSQPGSSFPRFSLWSAGTVTSAWCALETRFLAGLMTVHLTLLPRFFLGRPSRASRFGAPDRNLHVVRSGNPLSSGANDCATQASPALLALERRHSNLHVVRSGNPLSSGANDCASFHP